MKIDLKHLLEYEAVVQEVLDRFRAAKKTPVNRNVTIPRMVVTAGSQRWEIAEHEMKGLS